MNRSKQPTLKEEFLNLGKELEIRDSAVTVLWNFIEPNIKKTRTKEKFEIEIPLDKVKEFNELWPEHKLPTKTYGRCSERELVSAFKAFFKEYPEYSVWETIMLAAKAYLIERESEKWEYTRRSKYFVRRQNKDQSSEFLLWEYYERVRTGIYGDEPSNPAHFDIKVY